MNRGRRTIRLAKWAGVGLCVVIIATWAVSMRWAFNIDAGVRFGGVLESGVLLALWSDGPADSIEWMTYSAQPRRLSPLVDLNSSEYSVAFIPCWLPLAALAVPTALLFWLGRRRGPRAGHCRCGYGLTGNVSGRCPECEKPVSRTQRVGSNTAMKRQRRFRWFAKWAGVLLCVLIAGGWSLSIFQTAVYECAGSYLISITKGCIEIGWTREYFSWGLPDDCWVLPTDGPICWSYRGPANARGRLFAFPTLYGLGYIVPLWMPFLIVLLPTSLLFRLDRHKPRPGFCACGYDLTGNVSGVCPECGVRV